MLVYHISLCSLQAQWLQLVRKKLWSSGLCTYIENLQSQSSGSQQQQSDGLGSEDTFLWIRESALPTRNSEVLISYFRTLQLVSTKTKSVVFMGSDLLQQPL